MTCGTVIAAVFIVLFALEMDSERAAVIGSVAPLHSWYPDATAYIDAAVEEYDFTIASRVRAMRASALGGGQAAPYARERGDEGGGWSGVSVEKEREPRSNSAPKTK